MDNWELLGLAAGTICSVGFFPQIYRAYKTKQLDDLSYGFPLLMILGVSMWFAYGVHLNSYAMIISNAVVILCNILLIAMKYSYSKRSQ